MAQEAWRAYLELALGMTEASRKKAKKVVKELVGKGPATAEQLHAMVDDVIRLGVDNREALLVMVRAELERAMARLGLVGAEDLANLQERLRDLEERLARYESAEAGSATSSSVPEASSRSTAARKTAAKQTTAKPTAAKKSTAKKTAAEKTAAKKTTAPRTAAKKATAKATTAKKAATTTSAATDTSRPDEG